MSFKEDSFLFYPSTQEDAGEDSSFLFYSDNEEDLERERTLTDNADGHDTPVRPQSISKLLEEQLLQKRMFEIFASSRGSSNKRTFPLQEHY